MAEPSNVFTIPPGVSFVDSLAAGLLDHFADDPLALADALVLLPTRRACRALQDAFLVQGGGRALLLPALMPIGDIDADDLALAEAAGEVGLDVLDIPPAITEMRRRLMLTRMILRKAEAEDGLKPSPAQAAQLAAELARLLDQVQTERLSFDRLVDLVPDDYARHWQITLDFLRIVTENWPAVLAEEACIDPAERRNRVIEARISAWRAQPPDGPVIVAGSTGTVPATADLIEAVTELPDGMVVLPGLDSGLDPDTLDAIGPTHPQFAMVALLARLGLAPGDVPPWPWSAGGGDDRAGARAVLVAHAMWPAGAASGGLDRAVVEDALAGVSRVDCPGAQEEAGVVALMLREALNTPGRTAALITADRALARRVAAELGRWQVEIDDSAGRPLAETPPGVFLRLTATLAAEAAAPVALLAALKHPLAAGAMTPPAFRATARALELAVLRGPRPGPGFGGLRRALDARGPAGADLAPWLDSLARMAAPFMDLVHRDKVSVAELLAAHVAFAEALAATDANTGPDRLWAGEAGEAAARFVDEIAAGTGAFDDIEGRAWPALLEALIEGQVVRPRFGRHPRLSIWGPLEARLQHADLIVLGGLNEGTWPRDTAADPWMSRPMRADFGLAPLERRVGLAAHDFAQAFCAGEVALTRASRVAGTPTVPSRWLLRLDNVLQRAGLDNAMASEQPRRLRWQALLDEPPEFIDPKAPAPCPPIAARPRRLSVTQIETLMRDPYAIYARHVLGLRALDPIDADPGAAERGSLIHDALDAFLDATRDDLPDDAFERLVAIGEETFTAVIDRPGVRAFWWPRFLRIAEWFVAREHELRQAIVRSHGEVEGRLVIAAPAGPFTLTARADRVDELRGGRLAILDYKTGGVPTKKDMASGAAPQLPLEAAIAEAGGFEDVAAGEVARLVICRLTGGDPPGEEHAAGNDPAALAAGARQGLERLIACFDDPATPYLSQPDPRRAPRYSDYEHLARIEEWISQSGEPRR